jgi:hypothetical protein
VILGSVVGLTVAQEPENEPKAAAKKQTAPKKAAAAKQPETAPGEEKVWTEAELGGTKAPYAEITRLPTGKPIVAIHFPWRIYSRPSIEIRWLADDEPDTGEIRPLQFVADMMKGEITSEVYAGREKAWEVSVKKTLKIHDRQFEILGARNLLAKPAVTVLFPAREVGLDRPARAVFFLLDSWAADGHTLWLELPAEHFSQPGRIRIWFYRGDTILWWKTLAWPGSEVREGEEQKGRGGDAGTSRRGEGGGAVPLPSSLRPEPASR